MVSNACQALQEKRKNDDTFSPALRLKTLRTAEGVEISVRDNGIGMSAEVMAKIFTPFFSTKADQGTGLGMSLSHDIVRVPRRQHHASVRRRRVRRADRNDPASEARKRRLSPGRNGHASAPPSRRLTPLQNALEMNHSIHCGSDRGPYDPHAPHKPTCAA